MRWVVAQPECAASIRRDIARDMRQAGFATDDVEDVLLVASELFSNAVRHAAPLPSGELCVHWDLHADGLTVSVTDGGSAREPRMQAPGPHDLAGRGLAIVTKMTDFWGVRRDDGTVTVWAHLPVRRSSRRTDMVRSANRA